jgi:hypothetical protein
LSPSDKTCGDLTESRRDVARRLDAVESGRAAPNATAVFLAMSLLAVPAGVP